MKIIHKVTEQIPKDDNVWQMKTRCGIFIADYMCSYRWNKVNCPECLAKRDTNVLEGVA